MSLTQYAEGAAEYTRGALEQVSDISLSDWETALEGSNSLLETVSGTRDAVMAEAADYVTRPEVQETAQEVANPEYGIITNWTPTSAGVNIVFPLAVATAVLGWAAVRAAEGRNFSGASSHSSGRIDDDEDLENSDTDLVADQDYM